MDLQFHQKIELRQFHKAYRAPEMQIRVKVTVKVEVKVRVCIDCYKRLWMVIGV